MYEGLNSADDLRIVRDILLVTCLLGYPSYHFDVQSVEMYLKYSRFFIRNARVN